MHKLGAMLGLLLLAGCSIPMQGAEARAAARGPLTTVTPPPHPGPPMTAAAAPGPHEWTDQECSANALAQDIWGGIQIGGIALAGTSGFTAVDWKTDEGQNRAKFAALISGAIGLTATFISNNLKTRGADYCPKAEPKKD